MTALLLLLGAVLLVSTGLAALLLRRVPDPYPPEAAEAPGLDCGCAIGSVVLGCMVCSRTSCPTHQVHDHDPYPDGKSSIDKRPPDLVQRAYEEAGDTFGFQRATPWIDGNHPLDCAKRCCWEIRLDELHDAFDWHAAEHEMRSKR